MTQKTLTRFARRLALVLCAGAVALLALSVSHKPLAAPSALADPPLPSATDSKSGAAYDLSSLQVFRQVVVYIKDDYVDPVRIHPKHMFMAALEAVERTSAEVMVKGSAQSGHVEVTCGNATQAFDFSDVTSIWMIPHRIRPIFAFIQKNLLPTENRRNIEYAAINGMLSTLDPHSWFLNPESYREMQLQTKGEFGGIGFVIAMEKERLTVKKVLKHTPASKAGIKAGDHITRIEDESTINMDLNDAVSLLRGKPGTPVRLWIQRGNRPEKLLHITRASISIDSVTSQLLAGGVGYVHISSFAGTTSADLKTAIQQMAEDNHGPLKGLVMDLRSNPGGLLEQAYQVADMFIDKGTIVTTAEMGDKLREPKVAHDDPTDRAFPLAVLVNSESASASEIVTGALKNLNRAPIIGRQTFGKGSVQVLYEIQAPGTAKEAALKLTIAQYLTPGDKSIQGIGVTPDIELLPARVTRNRVDLFTSPHLMRETDLDKPFQAGFTDVPQPVSVALPKPKIRLRYVQPPAKTVAGLSSTSGTGAGGRDLKDVQQDDNDDDSYLDAEPDDDHVTSDYQVEFARRLLLAAPKTDRVGLLKAAQPFLAKERAVERAKIDQAIEKLGVDWSVTPRVKGTPEARVSFTATPEPTMAGRFMTLQISVTNTGTAPFERLRASTKCDERKTAYQGMCQVLEDREFLFGDVAPGETRTWSTSFKIPNHLPAADEDLSLVFDDAHHDAPPPRRVSVETLEAKKPAFAYTFQVEDPEHDNLAVPGETIDVEVDAKNTGAGIAKSAYVSLQNPGNENVFMKKGWVGLGVLKPGETKSATLSMRLKPGLDASRGIPFKLEIGDRDSLQFTFDKLSLPAAATAPEQSHRHGFLRLRRDETLLSAPKAGSAPIAQAHRRASLVVVGEVGRFDRVEWRQNRFGYVPKTAGTFAPGRVPSRISSSAAPVMFRDPPVIRFAGVDPTRAPVMTDADHFELSGVATDASGLMDVQVFVEGRKVFFHTAGSAHVARIPFQAPISLKPGNNLVVVVAREDQDFASQRVLLIHRQTPAIADRKVDSASKTQ